MKMAQSASNNNGGDAAATRPEPIDFYPFAYALFDETLAKHCWYCLDDEQKHKRCTGCQRALFCDKQCQTLAWKDHKFECRGIRASGGEVPGIEVRLLGRIVARHKAILCGLDKKDEHFYLQRQSRRNIMDIWAHTKSIEQDEHAMRKFEDIYTRLCRFYDPKALLPRQTVFELHCRDFINRHAISDKHYLREIGKGLYLDLCAYDHSCRPNTVYSCRSFVATLRALHPGVSLLDRSCTFYSYIDLLCAKQDRRKLLKDTWYFSCECERCVDGAEHVLTAMLCPHCPEEKPTRLCPFGESEYKDPQSQLITCPQCKHTLAPQSVMEAIAAMRFINDMLDKTSFEQMEREQAVAMLDGMLQQFSAILPPVNVFFCKIVQALLPHVDPDDNKRLLELHVLAEECIRVCYPHNHPALAFHLRNIGIFANSVGQRELALRNLREALAMFQFVMGAEHSLCGVTRDILEKVERGEEDGRGGEGPRKGEETAKKRRTEKSRASKGEKAGGEAAEEDGHGEERKKSSGEKGEEKARRKKSREEKAKKEQRNSPESEMPPMGGSPTMGVPVPLLEVQVNPPEEEETAVRQGESLVADLVQLSLSRAAEEVPVWERPAQPEELTLHIGSGSRPASAQSGTTTSGATLSPAAAEGGGHSPGGGVKNKLAHKKSSPRARTPLPPRKEDEDAGETSEASRVDEGEQRARGRRGQEAGGESGAKDGPAEEEGGAQEGEEAGWEEKKAKRRNRTKKTS